MTYQQRKLGQRCTYPACDDAPLPDNGECRYHQTASRDRKRYWWTYRRHVRRPKQLELAFV